MATLPIPGTYVSEDENFKVEIKSADPPSGVIEAVYEASYSPEGSFRVGGPIGAYAWVHNEQNVPGFAPFGIGFTAINRPGTMPYCIYDTWAGEYTKDNAILMTGVRSYVNNEGVVQTMSLGTLTFAQ